MMNFDKKWINLNVGGTVFTTSRSTLTKATPPNSPLHRISSNSTNVDWDRDENGAYLIDRDPVYFRPILNFLRHSRLILTRDITEEGILVEAEYFNLPELIKVVKQRINNRHRYLRACQIQQQMVLGNPLSNNVVGQQTAPLEQILTYQNPPIRNVTSSQQAASLSSLFNQQEYLTNYVNSILSDG